MSIRARGSDERRTPAKKGPAAEIAVNARSRGGWGVRLTPAHCHSFWQRMERYRKALTAAWHFRPGSRAGTSPALEDWLPRPAAGLIFPFPSAHL